jgi:hypothetical protein
MPKAETTFRPVGHSEGRMHGATAVLASGFSATEQQVLRAMMDAAGLQDVGIVAITAASLPLTLAVLAALPAGANAGETAELPRAVVMSGLTERQLHALMDSYRQSGLPRPLWASVTPSSAGWTIKYLLVELLKEREAMRQASEAQAKRETAAATEANGSGAS